MNAAKAAAAQEMMRQTGLDTPETLMSCCCDPTDSKDRRLKACLALGYLENREAIPLLIGLVRNSDSQIACSAMRALSASGSKRATRPLIEVVRGCGDDERRNAAISALSSLRDHRAEATLRGTLANRRESENIRSAAAQALGFLPARRRSVGSLISALDSPEPLIRWSALNSLGLVGGASSVDAVRRFIVDDAVVEALPDRETVSSAAQNALQNLEADRS